MYAIADPPFSRFLRGQTGMAVADLAATVLPARILRLLRQQDSGPGHRVSIAALCRTLQARPHDIKRALHLLGRQGAVCWRDTDGFVLAATPGDTVRDLAPAPSAEPDWAPPPFHTGPYAQSRNFRLAVEPLALLSMTGATGQRLQAIRDRHYDCLSRGCTDLAVLAQLDADFHLQLVALSQNPFMIQSARQQIALMHHDDGRGARELQRDLAGHLEIILALEQGRNTVAARALARHLDHAFRAWPAVEN
jgi:DNA-binding GntR family transcriptional regulator